MATKSSHGNNHERRKSAGEGSSSSDGTSPKGVAQDHIFGRMSKKFSLLTKFGSREGSSSESRKQQIDDLERRLVEVSDERDRLVEELRQSRRDVAEVKAELERKRQEVERKCEEHRGQVEHLERSQREATERVHDEHARTMDMLKTQMTAEWSDLEAKYRQQIEQLSAELDQVRHVEDNNDDDDFFHDVDEGAGNYQPEESSTEVPQDEEDDDEVTEPDRFQVENETFPDDDGLKEQLVTLQNNLDDANTSLVTLAIRLSELREEHEAEEKHLSDVQRQLQSVKDENLTLRKESQASDERIRQLETSCEDAEKVVSDLNQKVETLQEMNRHLEEKIKIAEREKEETEAKKSEDLSEAQKTLEETEKTMKTVQEKFEKEFEFLRNCNAEREQQMMDDYEWKLREIERDNKNKMEVLKKEIQNKLTEESEKVASEKLVQETEISKKNEKIVSIEAELHQLRGFSNELQKGMRAATAQVDQMRLLELRLREELRDTKNQLHETKETAAKLQSELTETKTACDRRLKAKEVTLKYSFEEKVKEMTEEWNDKLKEESDKIKDYLETQYVEQKLLALEELGRQNEQEMANVIRNHEQEIVALKSEVANVTSRLEDTERQMSDEIHLLKMASNTKEKEYRTEIERNDQELQKKDFELRSKEKQVEDMQTQLTAHRTTLDLVREEVERSKDDEILRLRSDQERQLDDVEEQWKNKLNAALESQLQSHKAQIQMARVELEKTMELATQKQQDQHECIAELKDALNERDEVIGRLNEEVQRLQAGLSKMSRELDFHGREILRVRHEASRQLCRADADAAVTTSDANFHQKEEEEGDNCAMQQLREALLEKDGLVKKLQEEKEALRSELLTRMEFHSTMSTSQPIGGVNEPIACVLPKRNKRHKDPNKCLSVPILTMPRTEGSHHASEEHVKRHVGHHSKHKSHKSGK